MGLGITWGANRNLLRESIAEKAKKNQKKCITVKFGIEIYKKTRYNRLCLKNRN